METRPEPPPEGRLIDAAAKLADISIREAARRAGISYGRWRQIVKGYQNIAPGSFAPVRNAPARTIARMAMATGRVTPAQLESEGRRPDAAAILSVLLAEDDDDATLPGIPPVPAAVAELEAIAGGVAAEISAARRRGIPDPQIFTDPYERSVWLTDLKPETDRVLVIAAIRSVPRRPPNSGTSNPPIELAG